MAKAPEYPGTSRKLKDKRSWFYEERQGLAVIAQKFTGEAYVGTTVANVPWAKVCKAVDNHRAIQAAKRKTTRRR